MNDNTRKWIADLKSGDFQQTTGRLRLGGRFCCLGVACERYRRETGNGGWTEGGHFVVGDEEVDLGLPAIVANWLGVSPPPPGMFGRSSGDEVDYDGGTLTAENDSGRTFKEIAELIESEPEGMFDE